jgi:hypothetical protein
MHDSAISVNVPRTGADDSVDRNETKQRKRIEHMALRISTTRLEAMKRRAEQIVMVTVYDYPTASLADEAGVDAILVGDSWAWLC